MGFVLLSHQVAGSKQGGLPWFIPSLDLTHVGASDTGTPGSVYGPFLFRDCWDFPFCLEGTLYKPLAFLCRAESGSNCYVCEFVVADDASIVPEAIQVC